ncbi:DedA family protein [Candidatus Gracilibacteria bacterium]|nr:DedA family protein [Candidatus Gracilibacteria bacterium]
MLSTILDQLKEWVTYIMSALGYPGITLIMLAENVFPPIPSEVVMPLAGFLAAEGQFNFAAAVFAGTLGSVLGAIVLYYVGALVGEPWVRPFVRRWGKWFWVSEADLDRALGAFDKYGPAIVFTGRLIPLIRSLISLPAGMKRMPMLPFLFYTTLGSAIWTTLLTWAGFILGRNWEQVLEFISTYQRFVLVALALCAMLWVANKLGWLRFGRKVEA